MFSVYDKQRPICKSYRNIRDMFSHYFIDSTGLCMLQSLLNETLYAFHILLNLTGTVSVFYLKAKIILVQHVSVDVQLFVNKGTDKVQKCPVEPN